MQYTRGNYIHNIAIAAAASFLMSHTTLRYITRQMEKIVRNQYNLCMDATAVVVLEITVEIEQSVLLARWNFPAHYLSDICYWWK